MANTIEAAPRRPAQETRAICSRLAPKGARIAALTRGLATSVRNVVSTRAGTITDGRSTGVTRSPRRKKIITCATFVRTSKKWTRYFFCGSFEFPI